ncbi:leucine-rich repeat-containing protein 45-like [Lytechinus variegatus]|uniref:leucine-rich repeat-containing protein 45-like n=1 Tax=Lytechinus variegatus TaxID=7654 RepID=UPI001BB22B83|nr:leucine-rich repeat-containing protein 45-like [Lytechinus variegatus]
MDSFKMVYLQVCRENGIAPQQSVLDQLDPEAKSSLYRSGSRSSTRSRSSLTTLDLSTTSLTAQTCSVLGRALSTNHIFQELRLSDCMIGDEGGKHLLHGLCSNTSIRVLDLKGNNMRGAGAEALGKLFRQNHSIKRICLEWNAVGVDGSRFANLAEGVSANDSLEVLDLRNNQIGHDGASQLATAITRNSSLQNIDLRWNNVGIVGGRSLLAGLQHNQTITQMDLAGNDIPQDIIKAIGLLLERNKERASLSATHQTRQDIMTREIKQLKNEKHQQARDLLRRIDQQNDQSGRNKRETSKKIRLLEEALAERKSAFNAVAAKLSKTEAELSLVNQKSHDLDTVLEDTRQEMTSIMTSHQREMQALREEKVACETKLITELSSVKERYREYEAKNEEMERKCQHQQEQIYELKEELMAAQAEVKMQATRTEELLQVERIKHRDDVGDIDRRHRSEIQHLRQGFEESERAYKDRIDRLEDHRRGIEEELSRIKAQQLTERLSLEEQILATKKQVRDEEHQRSKLLEDKIRVLQNAKDDIHQHASNQSQMVAEIQARNNNLTLEVESLKRHLQEMTQELAGKNNEKLSAVHQAEIQHQKQVQRMESKLAQLQEFKEKAADLEAKLIDQSRRHRSELGSKQEEVDSLQEQLRVRDMDIARYQEEENHRASALQSAISSYLNAPRSPAVTPRR